MTKEGGGFGDSKINVRGFEQNNIAVMMNGVPVNDMETGWVYWSNWAGLADVTNKMQVQGIRSIQTSHSGCWRNHKYTNQCSRI